MAKHEAGAAPDQGPGRNAPGSPGWGAKEGVI